MQISMQINSYGSSMPTQAYQQPQASANSDTESDADIDDQMATQGAAQPTQSSPPPGVGMTLDITA